MDAKSTRGQSRPISNRRKGRRFKVDRREAVRFEPNQENRRKKSRAALQLWLHFEIY